MCSGRSSLVVGGIGSVQNRTTSLIPDAILDAHYLEYSSFVFRVAADYNDYILVFTVLASTGC